MFTPELYSICCVKGPQTSFLHRGGIHVRSLRFKQDTVIPLKTSGRQWTRKQNCDGARQKGRYGYEDVQKLRGVKVRKVK